LHKTARTQASGKKGESPVKNMASVESLKGTAEIYSGGMDVEQPEQGVDPDALAYIKAKRKVDDLHKAKKMEKKGAHWVLILFLEALSPLTFLT